MWRDVIPRRINLYNLRFNPRARMGRDAPTQAEIAERISFNPRARMGRDVGLLVNSKLGIVSIHAPAWGATLVRFPLAQTCLVSIHAPAWGATYHYLLRLTANGFNPRARMGRDEGLE